ncbi:MAG: O-acetylhomoserine aminocarboxypropyltransferase/cysteine synthase [Candidatus Sungbacteria bacterium]|nr:O-acetylhomoserine aminocarboxypropyltransferase/cysteine synthase [Candidatus Sungbacteria bacterium]
MKKKLSAKNLWKLRPRTLEIHGGGDFKDHELRPVVDRVTAYPLGSFERAKRLFEGKEGGFIYSRINNRTVDRLEKRVAVLEGAEAGLATSSGMSAILIISLHLANGGGHIVSSNRLYGGVLHLFRELLPKLGIEVTLLENPYDLDEWERAIRSNTRFLALENPSNPLIDLFDPRPIAKIAHRHGIKLVIDNTLATPALAQPLKRGADIVWHSLSKYFGDGEVIGGCIVGKKRLIDDMRLGWFRTLGPCMSPDNAAIFLSHAESLFGRVMEHSKNALRVARFLSKHPKVRRVFYPAFGPRARENKKIMPQGFGGLMAFEIKGGRRDAKRVLESLRLFWHAPNIGESRSLVIHPATTTHGQLTKEELAKAEITQGTLRLSIGREDPLDLIEDLKLALAKI